MKKAEENSPFQKDVEKAQWRSETYRQALQQINANANVAKLREQYAEHSIDGFVKKYAEEKVGALEWGPQYKQWNERRTLEWIEEAWKAFEEIQQKKLFNLQCLWRAEKEEIEGIDVVYDFTIQNADILNCKIIPPVSEDDVELYRQYIFSNNYEHNPWHRWQDYERIKEAYQSNNEEGKVPEWYEFYDGRRGTAVYMTFPDTRGERQHYYMKLYHDRKKEQKQQEELLAQLTAPLAPPAEQQPSAPQAEPDNRPHLSYDEGDTIRWFVETFEDKQTQEYMQLAGGPRDIGNINVDWISAVHMLEEAQETIPLEAYYDWRAALHRAADNYRRRKIAEALPAAFEQYNMHMAMQIPFEREENREQHIKDLLKIKADMIERMEKGREMEGEE